MIVKELIEKLKAFDENEQIFINSAPDEYPSQEIKRILMEQPLMGNKGVVISSEES